MTRLQKILVSVGALLLLAFIIAICSFNSYLKFVDSYEMGYRFDARTGEVTVLNRTGWFKKIPFVQKINTVDLRPMQVCINANSRVLNCKLVKFNPAGLQLFISWHGRADYVVTTGTDSTSGTFNDILKSYAYDGSGKNYPFLTILRELRVDDVVASTAPPTDVLAAPK